MSGSKIEHCFKIFEIFDSNTFEVSSGSRARSLHELRPEVEQIHGSVPGLGVELPGLAPLPLLGRVRLGSQTPHLHQERLIR